MPRLQLLGSVCIDPLQGVQENPENVKGEQDPTALPRFRSRRTVALLGYLAAERRPVSRDFLAPFFWPDETLPKGRACLRRELHNLGQVLPDCWEIDRQMVAFAPSQDTAVDLYSLLELMEHERWGEASDLLSGEFLEGLYLDHNAEFELWLLSERERWRARAEEVLNHVIQGHTRRGRYSEALRHTHRLLKLSPWNESAYQIAMRLLAWTGQRGAALRQYEKCKEVLRGELNIEPTDETTILYRQIKEGDLEPPPQLPAFLTAENARHTFELPPFVSRETELTHLDDYLHHALRGQGQVVFITGGPGRGKTALLDNFSQRAMEKYPNILVASGKCKAYSGAGDPFLPFRDVLGMLTGDVENMWDAGAITREHAQRLWAAVPAVIQALLDHGSQLVDILVPGEDLLSRAVNIEGSDAPWIPQLRELVTQQSTDPERLIQSYLFQQMTRVLFSVTKSQPMLIILDDVQWADPASISLLFHLGRSLIDSDSRLMIVCAYRPDEVTLSKSPESKDPTGRHPLAKVLSEFKRSYGDIWIDLSQPEEGNGRVFIDALLDLEPNRLTDDFRTALSTRTEGHPLFTIELLRTMKERGDLKKDKDGRWVESAALDWDLFPARVEAAIEDRINRLNPALQEMLEVASIEGEEFTAQVLAQALGLQENTILRRLSHTLERQHRLVKESEEIYTKQGRISRFRFGHALFQDYLYQRLCAGEQRLLHSKVARALEEIYQGQLEGIAGQLARHCYLAGDWDQACIYYAMAADRASSLYANDEVLLHYSRAIELAERVSSNKSFLAKLHRGRGLVLERMGEFDRALSDLDLSLQISRSLEDIEMEWFSLINLGRLWAAQNYQRTRDYFAKALQLAREMDNPLLLASSLNWMGNWNMNMEFSQKATDYHLEALEIAERIGNQRELANTLDLLGIAKLMEGDLEACKGYYNRAIALQREMDDRLRLVSSLTGRAGTASSVVYLTSSPALTPSEADRDIREALGIADEIGLATGKAWALYIQGTLHIVWGLFGDAQKYLHHGLHLSSELEHYEYIVANHFGLGVLYNELYAPELARAHTEECLKMAEELHSQAMTNISVGVLSASYLLLDDHHAAQTFLEKVLSPGTPMDTMGKCFCWIRQAELALAQNNPDQALDIINRLIVSSPGSRTGQVITYFWKLKGDALAAMGQADKALPLLDVALENAVENKENFLLWKLHASLGQTYHNMDRESEAERAFVNAREHIHKLAETLTDEALKGNYLQATHEKLASFPLQAEHR